MLLRSAKKICLSFDDDNDRHYRDLLSVLVAFPGPDLDFEDLTPGAIDPNRVDRVKGVLTTQIRAATHMLVLVGAYANATHKDSQLIGTRNWQWWEIDQAKVEGKRLIAVKIRYPNPTPDPLLNAGAKWAMSYTVESIRTAIDEA
jgi:hypothetical protein